ncbi:MAG: hypothetical protein ACFFD7_08190 [Candidatus Thorarchaeota archaeon]
MLRKTIIFVLIGAVLMLIGLITPYYYDLFNDGYYDQIMIFWLWFQYRGWSDGHYSTYNVPQFLSLGISFLIVAILVLISGVAFIFSRRFKFTYNKNGYTVSNFSKLLLSFWIISGIITIVLSFVPLWLMLDLYPFTPPPPHIGFYLLLLGGILEVLVGTYNLYRLKSSNLT